MADEDDRKHRIVDELRDAGVSPTRIDDTRPATFFGHFLSMGFTGLRCTAGFAKEKRLSKEAVLLWTCIDPRI